MQAITGRALTVRDLISELKTQDPDAYVVFESDYGDRGHTMQALPVETVDCLSNEEYLKETAYSKSGIGIYEAKDPEDMPDADDPEAIKVVVLRS